MNKFLRGVLILVDKRSEYVQVVEQEMRIEVVLQCVELRTHVFFLKAFYLYFRFSPVTKEVQTEINREHGNEYQAAPCICHHQLFRCGRIAGKWNLDSEVRCVDKHEQV